MIGRFQDVIAACITGPGPAAVAAVRISGQGSWQVAQGLCRAWPRSAASHQAFTTELTAGGDALVLPFAEGRSYTGEEAVEVFLHGSPAAVRALLEACASLGARPALPGEFTQRAFVNGRMDLAQAEGVKALVEAMTEKQSRAASLLRQGRLTQEVSSIRNSLALVLASIEADADFSEEVGEADWDDLSERLKALASHISRLIGQAASSRGLQTGWRVALMGRPNAGKSSLLNSVLRTERAIVTPMPGTTRDTLEERVEIHGLPFVLIDTAGLREDPEEIEGLGMERARAAAQTADILWLVYNGREGWTNEDAAIGAELEGPLLRVATRRDLGGSGQGDAWVACPTGEGLAELLQKTVDLLPPEPAAPVLPRHEPLLVQAREAVLEAAAALADPVPPDLAVAPIQSALRLLGEITGETTPPDIIERIFREFCIGK